MSLDNFTRPLAVVTGASSGIGLELARCCAAHGFDLLIAADEPQIEDAARELRAAGASVDAVQADLATPEGVARLCEAVRGRPVEALLANAGRGLGKGFLDQDFEEVRRVIDTNVSGTLELLHKVAGEMAQRGRGRILITGSIAGLMPGSFQAAYNGSKAFLDSFAAALRNELEPSGVTVTCLMPGPTGTRFFERADLLDTKVGSGKKDDAAMVARVGFEAMMAGKGAVVSGLKNKMEAAVAHVTPAALLAQQHRRMAEPGSAHAPTEHVASKAMACGALGGAALGLAGPLLLGSRRAGPHLLQRALVHGALGMFAALVAERTARRLQRSEAAAHAEDEDREAGPLPSGEPRGAELRRTVDVTPALHH